MALQSSGAISLNNVNVELGNSGTAYITMGSAAVRGLFDVASGAISLSDGYGASSGPSRGLYASGFTDAADLNVIDYITLATTGNAVDFGDLSVLRRHPGALASDSRAVFAGGSTGAYPSYTKYNTMDYVTISTTGNATDFGDLASGKGVMQGLANDTRGIFGAGSSTALEYITIATTGNATSFGTMQFKAGTTGLANDTRGIFAGHSSFGVWSDIMEYITIATTGNATDFGNLLAINSRGAGCASATRGIIGGGDDNVAPKLNTIQYVTIATTGNATDFGDLTAAKGSMGAAASADRAVFAGGDNSSLVEINVIEYITIATTGNATDFGDLTVTRQQANGCSGS